MASSLLLLPPTLSCGGSSTVQIWHQTTVFVCVFVIDISSGHWVLCHELLQEKSNMFYYYYYYSNRKEEPVNLPTCVIDLVAAPSLPLYIHALLKGPCPKLQLMLYVFLTHTCPGSIFHIQHAASCT